MDDNNFNLSRLVSTSQRGEWIKRRREDYSLNTDVRIRILDDPYFCRANTVPILIAGCTLAMGASVFLELLNTDYKVTFNATGSLQHV